MTTPTRDKRRLAHLGKNGDVIDPSVWGQRTSSVTNHQVSAEEVLRLSVPVNDRPGPPPRRTPLTHSRQAARPRAA